MAVTTVTNFAVDNLPIVDFFDPNAAFNYGTSTKLSLVSRDGYELIFRGTDFAFNGRDEPTDGTVTDVFLYDPNGNLVGRVDDVAFSLEDYYETVAVDGRAGAFTADLMSGDDVVTGGSADDRLIGYAGDDEINSGSGFDTVSGDAGNDTIAAGAGDDDVDGGTGNDRIDGGTGRDLLYGFDGDDLIFGGLGADRLYGEKGDDELRGGSGDDSISGGAGKDTLIGGPGRDQLLGGADADHFQFLSDADAPDRVLDFRAADTLVFTAAGFDNLDANFDLVVNNNPQATTGNETFLFDANSHRLYYDADGTGAGGRELIATLSGVDDLVKADFLIV